MVYRDGHKQKNCWTCYVKLKRQLYSIQIRVVLYHIIGSNVQTNSSEGNEMQSNSKTPNFHKIPGQFRRFPRFIQSAYTVPALLIN